MSEMSEQTPLLINDGSSSPAAKKKKKGVTFADDTKDPETPRYPKRKQSAHNRYQSSVTHLPKHITASSPLGNSTEFLQRTSGTGADLFTFAPSTTLSKPLLTQSSSNSYIAPQVIIEDESLPPTKLDPDTQKQVPYIPNIQLCLLWFNASIFTVSIMFVILVIILDYIVIFEYPVILGIMILFIIASISGLVFTYSYRDIIFHVLDLNKRIYDFVMQAKLQQINAAEDEMKPTSPEDQVEENEVIPLPKVSLLKAFRRGDFHTQLAICSSEDLKQLLPVVLSRNIFIFA